MYNGKYISSARLIERIYANHAIEEHLDPVWILEHIGDCIDLLGCNIAYINKVTGHDDLTPTVKIIDFKGILPCDLISVIQVREYCSKTILRESTDSFHHAKKSPGYVIGVDLTYKIQDGQIEVNFEMGELEISYTAFPTDSKGYPLIPDNIKVILACEMYVVERVMYKLFMRNDIAADKYQLAQQERMYYLGAATMALDLPSMDKMESIKNSWLRLIPHIDDHSDGFVSHSQGEERYKV